MIKFLCLVLGMTISFGAHCESYLKCDEDAEGHSINCVRVPGKDPSVTITEEDTDSYHKSAT